jgi:threonyl-tRNA synthetase
LPIRYAEFGTVYRYEQSGELHGLTRVRGFTQDDAHIFCRPDQVKDEFKGVMDIVMIIFKALDFKILLFRFHCAIPITMKNTLAVSKTGKKLKKQLLKWLKSVVLKNTVVKYGEAAFYGPKMDFMVKDALGQKLAVGNHSG